MRAWTCILLTLITVDVPLFAQTVHQIPANSTGNKLTLTIANESASTEASGITVWALRRPEGVKFSGDQQTLKSLAAGKESDVTFAFDVDRKVHLNQHDTLEFGISDNGGRSWTKSILVTFTAPETYALEQNFPNPFNPTTRIYYQLPKDSYVELVVYDLLGREVSRLVEGVQPAGFQDVEFNAKSIASGVYIYRVSARASTGTDKFRAVKKLMILK
jgi:hypothetical protein